MTGRTRHQSTATPASSSLTSRQAEPYSQGMGPRATTDLPAGKQAPVRSPAALLLIVAGCFAAIIGLHPAGLLQGELWILLTALGSVVVRIIWMVRRERERLEQDEPPAVRLPRGVRRRRGLPRDRGTLAPADPAAYRRQKAARREHERLERQERQRLVDDYSGRYPWRLGLWRLQPEALEERPDRPGHYRVRWPGTVWRWEEGDWAPLGSTQDVTLEPPAPGMDVQAYRVQFEQWDRPEPGWWVEITGAGEVGGDSSPPWA